jgi:hypothetical protein
MPLNHYRKTALFCRAVDESPPQVGHRRPEMVARPSQAAVYFFNSEA